MCFVGGVGVAVGRGAGVFGYGGGVGSLRGFRGSFVVGFGVESSYFFRGEVSSGWGGLGRGGGGFVELFVSFCF